MVYYNMTYPTKNTSTYSSPTKNNDITFLVTEILEFLMTENNEYMVTAEGSDLPAKNTSTYSAPTKNSSTSSNSSMSGQNFIDIGEGFNLLIDTANKLLIEPINSDWSYATKN